MTNQNAGNNSDTILGRAVVQMGLATDAEVADCLHLQKELSDEGKSRTLADLLVANGILTSRQVERATQSIEAERSSQQIPGYRLLEKIGEGAMGKVFKAQQLSLDRIVAIKVLPRRYMADASFVERFYAEGRAAAKLNHPNIVQAIDVGQAGEYHYFVMEYVEGYTVYDYLEKHGKYAEADALKIIIQIAEALRHAHDKNFIHRDVKPKNIMITRTGQAKLADMGLARQASDREAAEAESGRAYGTPYYISPEQIRGAIDIDFRADIYSLGCTFYHMVTGRVPFDGPNPSAVMHMHLKKPPTPPDHVSPKLSAGASEIIEVMMAKNRDERYASTADLLDDLRAVAAGNAPLQARKVFDVSKLADLEAQAPATEANVLPSAPVPLTSQPLFWVAVVSVMVNVVLLLILLLK